MKKIIPIAVFTLSVVATLLLTALVFNLNQEAGIYVANWGSISDPVFENVIFSGFILLLVILALLLPVKNKLFLITAMILLLVAASISGLYALSWFYPHHYPVFAAYLWLCLLSVFFTYRMYKQSNINK